MSDQQKDDDLPVLIPIDPKKRAALAQMAGLSDDERHALDLWCAEQAQNDLRHACWVDADARRPS